MGVGLGVGVGVPPPPTAANISTRPQPKTLFGGPAVPHWVEEIKIAALFKTVSTGINLVLQLGIGRPEQCHGPSDMRSRHGRAAGKRIRTIGGVAGRASACAWSSDIRFYPVASIDSDRTAAAKESNGIGAGVQSPDRVRGLINGRRIGNCGTARTGITCRDHHHDASSALGLQRQLAKC